MDLGRQLSSDVDQSLAQIRATSQLPIASRLVAIGRHKGRKSLQWVQYLTCLSPADLKETPLKRRRVDNGAVPEHRGRLLQRRRVPLTSRDYIAVSYTWDPSNNEDSSCGGYEILTPEGGISTRSVVRDIVLDRVIRFSESVGCANVWIDKECIDQQDNAMKQEAIQSMDLVYSKSRSPVALLSVVMEDEPALLLLISLLRGDLVLSAYSDDSQQIEHQLSERLVHQSSEVLKLLQFITSDLWWKRAWTFPEDYMASNHMVLLIAHPSQLESIKKTASDVLGDLAGELGINSAKLREEVTRYCMAHASQLGQEETCQEIMGLCGKYRVFLHGRSMSPTIFQDIGNRSITVVNDRLAIAANCCRYAMRLDTESIRAKDPSLSLSMLALYFLNGEIMDCDNSKVRASLSDNIFRFLHHQSMDGIESPIPRELTFIKSCRFVDVRLEEEGIKTTGQLWRRGRRIGSPLPENDEQDDEPDSSQPRGLTRRQRRQLRKLARDLRDSVYGKSYLVLAEDIDRYLDDDSSSFPKQYKDIMAGEIVAAIEADLCLYVACLVNPATGQQYSPYQAIFVSDEESYEEGDDDGHPVSSKPVYFFTAESYATKNSGDVNKHVSLEVEVRDDSSQGLPLLSIRRWANGLTFPDHRHLRVDVIFPWPAALVV